MARTLVLTTVFTEDDPGSGYVMDDVVKVYYDPTSDPTPYNGSIIGYTVEKNGIAIPAGGNIIHGHTHTKNSIPSNATICNGTTRIGISTNTDSFPYVYTITYPNSPSCNIGTPDVCDLIMVGVPIITPASSEILEDGIIEVHATSSRVIQYRLGSDFVYGDGTGQSSGIFTVGHGTYRVYLRDSINCHTNILVTVGIDTSYGDYKRLTYFDRLGQRTLIKLQKKDFVGEVVDVKGGPDPFTISLRGEGDNDKFVPVLQTTSVLTLASETNFEFIDLFTNNPKKFRIKYYKLPFDFDYTGDPTGSGFSSGYSSGFAGDSHPIESYIMWMGYVLPQQYMEEYKAPPYYTTINAKDGLSDLKNLLFLQDDGQEFFERIKTIELIAFCLRKTGINLNIRSGINLYAQDMDQFETDDPLDQAYIDPEAFYLDGTPTIEFVLTELIRPYRARLVQWEGRWNILRVEELLGEYDYREFTPFGIYDSNGSVDPIVDVDKHLTGNCLEWANSNQTMELRPGFGKVRVVYHLGNKRNILRNGDFRIKQVFDPLSNDYVNVVDKTGFQVNAPYPISEGAEVLNDGNVAYAMKSDLSVTTGEAYIQSDIYSIAMGVNNSLKLTIVFKIPIPIHVTLAVNDLGQIVSANQPIPVKYQKIRLVVKYGNHYLQNDGTWVLRFTEMIIYSTDYGTYSSVELTALQPDPSYSTEKDFSVRVYQSFIGHYEYATPAALKTRVTGYGNLRGAWDASGGLFPSAAVVAGDYWTISVPGVLGGIPVTLFSRITAVINAPGQDPNNWGIFDGVLSALPTGTRTEVKNPEGYSAGTLYPGRFLYYELQDSTAANDDIYIIRPNDYDASVNPVQWIWQPGLDGGYANNPTVEFLIDKISIEFLDNGKEVFDTVVREIPAEPNNNLVLQEDVFSGSMLEIVTTLMVQGLILGLSTPQGVGGKLFDIEFLKKFFSPSQLLAIPRVSNILLTQTIISAKLIYAGYISDADGNGYLNWSRDSVDELTTLHDIFMKSAAAQYNKSWRKITGSLAGNDAYLGFLNVIREVQQGESIIISGEGFSSGYSSGFGGGVEEMVPLKYLPQSLTIHDLEALYDGEFLELTDITQEGMETVPFTSGYTAGFGGGFD